jgi:hypothetical protein
MFFMSLFQGLIKISFDNTDFGPHRPPGTYPIQRRGEEDEVTGCDTSDYEAIEENLEGLTTDVLIYLYR